MFYFILFNILAPIAAAIAAGTLVEYLVHRYLLHSNRPPLRGLYRYHRWHHKQNDSEGYLKEFLTYIIIPITLAPAALPLGYVFATVWTLTGILYVTIISYLH